MHTGVVRTSFVARVSHEAISEVETLSTDIQGNSERAHLSSRPPAASCTPGSAAPRRSLAFLPVTGPGGGDTAPLARALKTVPARWLTRTSV